MTGIGLAHLDTGGVGLLIGSVAQPEGRRTGAAPAAALDMAPGIMRGFKARHPSVEELAALNSYSAQADQPGRWVVFRCVFDSGVVDELLLRVGNTGSLRQARDVLRTIWPVFRQDCVTEARQSATRVGDDALLWMISQKIDVAVMAVNAKGEVLRLNSAAKDLLEETRILRSRCNALCAAREADSKLLRDAIADCAASEPGAADTVVFLEGIKTGRRVPVTLSRFAPNGEATGLVLVTLPIPPERKRIEMLARQMGLTQSEARVAGLLQLGISNRDAAEIAGLKEQTFSTYAKRAMSKLNVKCRAEMAQLLTWQAHGRRAS
ncbi:MAG: helix-turn-helix transcriptional regulator [Paracoccaceae bacterium]